MPLGTDRPIREVCDNVAVDVAFVSESHKVIICLHRSARHLVEEAGAAEPHPVGSVDAPVRIEQVLFKNLSECTGAVGDASSAAVLK